MIFFKATKRPGLPIHRVCRAMVIYAALPSRPSSRITLSSQSGSENMNVDLLESVDAMLSEGIVRSNLTLPKFEIVLNH